MNERRERTRYKSTCSWELTYTQWDSSVKGRKQLVRTVCLEGQLIQSANKEIEMGSPIHFTPPLLRTFLCELNFRPIEEEPSYWASSCTKGRDTRKEKDKDDDKDKNNGPKWALCGWTTNNMTLLSLSLIQKTFAKNKQSAVIPADTHWSVYQQLRPALAVGE